MYKSAFLNPQRKLNKYAVFFEKVLTGFRLVLTRNREQKKEQRKENVSIVNFSHVGRNPIPQTTRLLYLQTFDGDVNTSEQNKHEF